MPERKKKRKYVDDNQDARKKQTEIDKLLQTREYSRKKMQDNLAKEVLKIQIGRNREYIKELEHPINEVEEEVNKHIKYDMKKAKRNQVLQKQEEFKRVKKLPLIDDMKFKYIQDKSLAENKIAWKGKKGKFQAKDLIKWFKLFDETKLYHARKYIGM